MELIIGDWVVGLFEETHRLAFAVQATASMNEEKRKQTEEIKIDPAGVQQAIANNENSKRLTNVPKFCSNAMDMLTAHKFIKRIKQAATIGTWNDTKKCAEFCHLLQSKANGFMSATLKNYKTANNDWNEHKKLFLQFYNIKGTATLLHDMKQGPTEKVPDFWTKIQVNCDRIHDTIDPVNIEMLKHQDFLAADWADIVKECRWARSIVQDFFK